ncbi:TPA: type II toxin-antitoxin system RelE/ParE family toxin [bacterium]|nr:type II toxin-antitoxin system RelE/ParE family toxin [bacterium]
MAYHPVYHPIVLKEDIPAISKNIHQRIKTAIEERLLKEPAKYGKPLRYSLKSLWTLRVGDYRVIYKIEDDNIIILKIGHRKEAYQKIMGRTSL